MATTTKLKRVLDILDAHGEGEHPIQADHDIIYLNSGDEDSPFAEALMAEGAHWTDQDGWYIFV